MSITPLVVTTVASAGVCIAADKIGNDYYPVTEILWGPYGAPVPVDTGTPLPVALFANVSAVQVGTWNISIASGNSFSITAGSSVGVTQITSPWTVSLTSGGTFTGAVSLAAGSSVVTSIANTVNVSVLNITNQVSLAAAPGTVFGALGAATSGGLLTHSMITSVSTNLAIIAAGSHQLYGYSIFNTVTTPRMVRVYDVSIVPSVGNTPKLRLYIPAASLGAGAVQSFSPGVPFTNGIGFSCTPSIADSDTNATAQNDCIINFYYY